MTNLSLKPGQTVAPFLVITASGARCIVVINASDSPNGLKVKESPTADGVLVRNKDVFLPQIADDNSCEPMDTGECLLISICQAESWFYP